MLAPMIIHGRNLPHGTQFANKARGTTIGHFEEHFRICLMKLFMAVLGPVAHYNRSLTICSRMTFRTKSGRPRHIAGAQNGLTHAVSIFV